MNQEQVDRSIEEAIAETRAKNAARSDAEKIAHVAKRLNLTYQHAEIGPPQFLRRVPGILCLDRDTIKVLAAVKRAGVLAVPTVEPWGRGIAIVFYGSLRV